MKKVTPLKGLHHVTAITSSSEKIYEFYTNILGMRLVKKNVNQDDLTAYHLFFADDRGNPGTDMTFFKFKGIGKHIEGTNEISRTSLRVPSDAAIDYWIKRFKHYGVNHSPVFELFGHKAIYFDDFDEQRYALISDEKDNGVAGGEPWHKGPVPDEFAIYGLGPIFLRVANYKMMKDALVDVMQMENVDNANDLHLFYMGEGGNGASVIVEENRNLPQGRQGYGAVHHVAFRIKDREELDQWTEKFEDFGYPNSGFVERFYFKSLYVRVYPNILFELATDGPGFIDDEEDYETLGEKLTLPPHLRHKRSFVESQLAPFDTVRSNKIFKKEYFND